MPDSAIRISEMVKKNDIDVVLDREFDRIGRDRGGGGDQDGVNLVCRDLERFIVCLHEEAVFAFFEVRSAGV